MILTKQIVVAVETSYNKLGESLYELFVKELNGMLVGHSPVVSSWTKIMDLVNALDYLKHNSPDRDEHDSILNNYTLISPRTYYSITPTVDYYKGKSFRFLENWEPSTHYCNDDFFVDFVTYEDENGNNAM